MNLKLLAEPFHPNDIEWRVATAELEWVRIVPYLTARAVMERLDSVCGTWPVMHGNVLLVNTASRAVRMKDSAERHVEP